MISHWSMLTGSPEERSRLMLTVSDVLMPEKIRGPLLKVHNEVKRLIFTVEEEDENTIYWVVIRCFIQRNLNTNKK